MTTLTFAPATDSARPTHAPGFTDLLRSEWTKFRTLRSTWWSLGITVVLSLGVSIAATAVYSANFDTEDPSIKQQFQNDTISLFLQPGAQFGQLAIAVLGALLITAEYSTGMIRATVLAAPRRASVIAAKAVVLSGVVLAMSEVIAWISFFVGSAIARKHVDVTLATPGSLRAILGFGLVMSMIGLISLAIGTLLRHTAGAISVALGTNLVLPILFQLIPGSVGRHLSYAMPQRAGLLILDRTEAVSAPYSQWAGLGILTLWTIALLALAFWSIKKRDV